MQFNLLEKKKVLFLNSYVYYRWEKKKWKKKGINLDLFFPQKDIESDDGWGESGETATAETVRNCRSCRRSKRVDQNLQVLKWSRVAILYLYIGAEWCHCLTKSFCLGLASVSDLCSLIWSASRPRVLLYCLEDMKFRKIHVSHDRLFGRILLNSGFICVIDTVSSYLGSIWEEGMKWNEIKKYF